MQFCKHKYVQHCTLTSRDLAHLKSRSGFQALGCAEKSLGCFQAGYERALISPRPSWPRLVLMLENGFPLSLRLSCANPRSATLPSSIDPERLPGSLSRAPHTEKP